MLGCLGDMRRVCVVNGSVDDRLRVIDFGLLLRHRGRLGDGVEGQVASQENSKLIL